MEPGNDANCGNGFVLTSGDRSADDVSTNQPLVRGTLGRGTLGTESGLPGDVAARIVQLLGVVHNLHLDDHLTNSVVERLNQVDLLQEQILEHLDELDQLLQWQLEHLVVHRSNPALAVASNQA